MLESTVERQLLTLEAYLALQAKSEVGLEIIDGEIREKIMPGGGGGIHVHIGGNVFRPLDRYIQAHPEHGLVFSDGLTYLMGGVEQGLKDSFIPDVSFIRASAVPADWDFERPFPGVPTLAVEVVSPGDEADDLIAKVGVYLAKGTEQVWVLYPRSRSLHQYHLDENGHTIVRVWEGDQALDVSALFPGIEPISVSALFALPAWLREQPPQHGG
jgi:Uma2 family endonuclease